MTRGPRTHDQFVERIYDLAEAPEGWQTILAEAAATFEAEKAHFFLLGSAGAVEQSEFHGYDDPKSISGSYHVHFQSEDPRITLSLANPGRVFCDADGRYKFERTPVYNELLKFEDIRHSLFVQVPVQKGLIAAQAFMRPHSGAPFERKQVNELQRLLPHLCQAVRLGRLLSGLRAELGDLRLALNLLPIPIGCRSARVMRPQPVGVEVTARVAEA